MEKIVQIHKHPQGHWMLIDKLNYQIGYDFKTSEEASSYAQTEGYSVTAEMSDGEPDFEWISEVNRGR